MKRKSYISIFLDALLLIVNFIPFIKYSVIINMDFDEEVTYHSIFTKIFTEHGSVELPFAVLDIIFMLLLVSNAVINILSLKNNKEYKALKISTFIFQIPLFLILLFFARVVL